MIHPRTFILLALFGFGGIAMLALAGDQRGDPVPTSSSMAPSSLGGLPGDANHVEVMQVPIHGVSIEEPIRMLATKGEELIGPWQIEGQVAKGHDGVLENSSLIVRVHAGFDSQGTLLQEGRALTDLNGEFTWATATPEQTVTIEVTPDVKGHCVYPATAVVIAGDAPPTGLRPMVYELDALLQGRIVDPNGAPIIGARVISHLAETVSNGEGQYSLSMASDYDFSTVRAVAAGHAEAALSLGALRAGSQPVPDLVLAQDYGVQGRVFDSEGAPIVGATVCTYPRERNQTTTDEEGKFRLGGLNPAKKRTRVSAGMQGFSTAAAYVMPESAATELEFVLDRGIGVAGRVADPHGKAVPHATVSVGNYPSSRPGQFSVTDSEGRFLLENVTGDSNTVWALRQGWAPGKVDLRIPDECKGLDGIQIELGLGFEFAGIVLDENDKPVAGARVNPSSLGIPIGGSFVGNGTNTGADGRFLLQQVPDERVLLRVYAQGYSRVERRVKAGTSVKFRVKGSGSLAGHVVDGATGEAVPSFVVKLVQPRLARFERSLTNYGYEWRTMGMSFVAPDGVWSTGHENLKVGAITGVKVSAPGYAETTLDHVVVANDPDPAALRIELHSGVTLRGFVTDATSGTPIASARIRRMIEGNPSDTQRYVNDESCWTHTDSEGIFELRGVSFGRMFLVVDETEFPVHLDGPFDVDGGSSTLERTIAVTSGGGVEGRFLDGAGNPLAYQSVKITALETPTDERPAQTTQTDATGAFAFAGLPPGPHHLIGSVDRSDASMAQGIGVLQLIQVKNEQIQKADLRPTGHCTLIGTVEFDGELPGTLSVSLRPEQVPGVWASRVLTAGVFAGKFTAPHLDSGKWKASVFFHDENRRMIMGSAWVQVTEQGVTEVHINARPMR
ncbi:MAG: hypothetical protein GY930_08705 [bacterium]|nr:hypothetical protein [bacterium]